MNYKTARLRLMIFHVILTTMTSALITYIIMSLILWDINPVTWSVSSLVISISFISVRLWINIRKARKVANEILLKMALNKINAKHGNESDFKKRMDELYKMLNNE